MIEKLKPDAVKPGDIVHLDGRVLGRHPGDRPFHRRAAQGPRHRRRRAALCPAPRRRPGPRRRRPPRGPRDAPDRPARRQLAGRRRSRRERRGRYRACRPCPLDPPAEAGHPASDVRRAGARPRGGRGRGFPGPGGRLLLRHRAAGADSRRRNHLRRDERGRRDARPARSLPPEATEESSTRLFSVEAP